MQAAMKLQQNAAAKASRALESRIRLCPPMELEEGGTNPCLVPASERFTSKLTMDILPDLELCSIVSESQRVLEEMRKAFTELDQENPPQYTGPFPLRIPPPPYHLLHEMQIPRSSKPTPAPLVSSQSSQVDGWTRSDQKQEPRLDSKGRVVPHSKPQAHWPQPPLGPPSAAGPFGPPSAAPSKPLPMGFPGYPAGQGPRPPRYEPTSLSGLPGSRPSDLLPRCAGSYRLTCFPVTPDRIHTARH
ncbi:hypothetical protein CALCODRAFT_255013 [Calocera cornea HHB12733]|uniref:Uncharacterized protein n=1 Tax=Calocera cornea HHB12733 TaxID=1353952 RepID=A0A165GN55_9BASI|nr:hypothetical protein CALCODRAFT_255013 [Calocera cornea HHB12733]